MYVVQTSKLSKRYAVYLIKSKTLPFIIHVHGRHTAVDMDPEYPRGSPRGDIHIMIVGDTLKTY